LLFGFKKIFFIKKTIKMKTAILSIQIDEKNNLEVRYQGENSLEMPMIGALKFAEKYLVDRINSRSAVAMTQSEPLQTAEKKVKKKDAI
jgi:hypothetical protein